MKAILNLFHGFDDSIHSVMLDDALSNMFEENQDLIDRVNIDWQKAHQLYAADYTENVANIYSLPIKFLELESPRYYNFETDEIIVDLPDSLAVSMYDSVNQRGLWSKLQELATKKLSSRDGFSSFYNNNRDIDLWGFVTDWDNVQLSLLLEFYMVNHDNHREDECEIMEDSTSNGVVLDIIEKCIIDGERLFKIANYLNERTERGYK